jgi:uncharacterized protein YabN with tetrapyrrole methylase and pyrophosphatase domain
METMAREEGDSLSEMKPDELEALWQQAKRVSN